MSRSWRSCPVRVRAESPRWTRTACGWWTATMSGLHQPTRPWTCSQMFSSPSPGTARRSPEWGSKPPRRSPTSMLGEAPEKGLDPAFWIAGAGSVAFYGGDPPERMIGRPMDAQDIAVDLASSQRAYIAEADRVVALEGDPERLLEGKLEVMATRSLGERVQHLTSDELHVFAATQDKLVAMRRETLETGESVEFGP